MTLSFDEFVYELSIGGKLYLHNGIEYAYVTFKDGKIMYNNDIDKPIAMRYTTLDRLYLYYLNRNEDLICGRKSMRYI